MSYDGVRATPVILAGLLGALGLAVLANALVTSIRARRHELAVLKTLGFSSRQIRSTIAWQATALVAVTTAIGIVLGTALGRVLWRSFVADTGVQTGSAIPFLAALLIMAISVAFANVVAALPAHRAARVAPAMVLRSE